MLPRLRAACGVKEGAYGREAFDAVLQPTVVSTVPHKTKSLINALAENWKLRPMSNDGTRIVIAGAGPVGLRAAVEAALMGMRVHVLEKRDVFSRVNILMLYDTADDMIAYGGRTFYEVTNRNIGSAPLHLGTREIGSSCSRTASSSASFSYGSEIVAVQAPPASGAGVAVGGVGQLGSDVADEGRRARLQAEQMDDARRIGQGKCNMLQQSELDPSFALGADDAAAQESGFDALLLAEGEWSTTCTSSASPSRLTASPKRSAS